MKWLLTGGAGMLPTDMLDVLLSAGEDATRARRDELDITRLTDCELVIAGFDVVVNAAAWTAVDDAEAHEDAAFSVNATGAANVARACAATGARLIHVSTDYVFSGEASSPYPEDAPLCPRSAYGRSKAAGEWAVRAEHPGAHIVRTAWLYGEHGSNFVATMSRLAAERDTLDVVDDQRGQPTWTRDLATALLGLIKADAPPGTYHGTSSGETSWYGLTREIFTLLGHDPDRVRPTTTSAFPRPAPRPAYSVLGHRAWAAVGLEPIRHWRDALAAAAPFVMKAKV